MLGVGEHQHRQMSMRRACWFVSEGVLLRDVAEMQLLGGGPPTPQYAHLQGPGGEGLVPLLCSPTSGGTSLAELVRQVWGPAKGFGSLRVFLFFTV